MRVIKIEIQVFLRSLQKCTATAKKEANQMFYDLVSGVFYCTTSYPIDSLIYDRDYKRNPILNWFLMYNQEAVR